MSKNNGATQQKPQSGHQDQSNSRTPVRHAYGHTPFPFGVTPGEVGQLFDRLFESTRPGPESSGWSPDATIWEDAEGYHVEMDLPGVTHESLEVTMEAGRLMISASRSFDTEQRRLIHNERRFGEVARSIELPDSIDADSIEASLDCGLLRVDLKKRAEVLPRKIDVRVKN